MRGFIRIMFAVSVGVLYGEGRVMIDVLGLSLVSLRSSFVLVSVFLGVSLLLSLLLRLAIVQSKSTSARVSIKWTFPKMAVDGVKLIFIVVASCMVAELYIELDELSFVREVSKTNVARCARSRAWPFGGTSMVYDEQIGFWATD